MCRAGRGATVLVGLALITPGVVAARAADEVKLRPDPIARKEWQAEPAEADLFQVVEKAGLAQWWALEGEPTLKAAEEQGELGLPRLLATGDVNGDGKKEVVCATDAGWLLIFSHDGRLLLNEELGMRIRCLATSALYGEGTDQILVGGDSLQVLNESGDVLWKDDHSVSGMAVGDVDKDGATEVVAAGQALRVLDAKTGEEEWSAEVASQALAAGDLDGDGLWEFVLVSREKLFMLSSDGDLIWEVEKGEDRHSGWYGAVATVDLDGDGDLEVVACEYKNVCAFDSKGEKLWARRDPAGVLCIAVGDTDGDKKPEIAFGSTNYDVHLYGGDGSPIAALPAGSWVSAMAFADLDTDGKDEIIVGSEGKSCFVYAARPTGELLWRYFTGQKVSAVVAEDLDGDGKVEVMVAADDVCFLDHKGVLEHKFALGGSAKRLEEDLDGDGRSEVVVGSNLLSVYGDDGTLKWTRDIAYVWSLHVADVDRDGSKEIIVGCYDNTVYLIGAEGNLRWQRQLDWIRGEVSVEESENKELLDIVVKPQSSYEYRFDVTGKLLEKRRHQR